jgi:hypothetical protein
VNLKFKLGDQTFNKQFYVTGLGNKGSFLVLLGCINTTQSLTGKREELLGNPTKLIGDALLKKDKESERNDNLK